MHRRSFVEALGTASLAGAAVSGGRASWAADAQSPTAARTDYFEQYIDVIRVWKKHDVEAVLAHMSDDIVWYVFVSQPPVRGKADARALLTKLAGTRHAENWRVFHHAVQGSRLFVEGVDDFTDTNDHRIAVPYAGVIEFKDGLITGWRDYFDAETVEKMKTGGPVPDAIQPLVSRKGQP